MIDFKVVDGMVLPLGWQDTKNVATFVFDVSQFEGGGIFTIRVWRPGDAEGHLVAYGRDDDGNLTWTPDEFETAKAGQGQVQIFLMNGDTIVASRWWQTEVRRSVPLKGKLPKEAVKWYQQMVSLAQDEC